MNRDDQNGIALILMAIWLGRVFKQITGMTLAEWDEWNYQRVMAAGEEEL